MNDQEATQLREENTRLQESLVQESAKSAAIVLATKELAAIEMPEASRVKVAEAVSAKPPIADGKLDEATFKTQIMEAAAAELRYLQSATGYGTGEIQNLGNSTTITESATTPVTIAHARAQMGLS